MTFSQKLGECEAAWPEDVVIPSTTTADLLYKHFGERCDEVVEGCPCCKRWSAFDKLFESPYK